MLPRHLFSQPGLLGTLLALPVLTLLAWRAARRRRRDLGLLAGPKAAERLRRAGLGHRRFSGACAALGLIFLGLGSAGPQWDREPEQTAAGRDLIVILDCSRVRRSGRGRRRSV